jgi:hypothetical protein
MTAMLLVVGEFCRLFREQKVAKENFSRYFAHALFHRAQTKQTFKRQLIG